MTTLPPELQSIHPLVTYSIKDLVDRLAPFAFRRRRALRAKLVVLSQSLGGNSMVYQWCGYEWLAAAQPDFALDMSKYPHLQLTTHMLGQCLNKHSPVVARKCLMLDCVEIPSSKVSQFIIGVSLWRPIIAT